MTDILKAAEIAHPSQIVDDNDEDEEYLYDLRKKQQRPLSINSVKSKIKTPILISCLLFVLYQFYGFITYTTFPYYINPIEAYNKILQKEDYKSNLVSISYDNIQGLYHDAHSHHEIQWSEYAYISYSTNLNYLCASLMLFRKLGKEYNSKADFVLFYSFDDVVTREDYSAFLKKYRSIAKELNIKMVPLTLNYDYEVNDLNFKHSFSKLELFQFKKYSKYISQYKKLIYLDSDVYLNDKLDELFFLPDEFDIAMPIAYWLTDPQNNYKNLLSRIPSTEPVFDTAADKLEYFRIQNSKGLKWSTALMVIKPSAKLTRAINEELYKRGDNDYDMDIINSIFNRANIGSTSDQILKKLTLPHKSYFMITGDIFLTPKNRQYYLTHPLDMQFLNRYSLNKCNARNENQRPYWCKVSTQRDNFIARLNQTKILHFSDFPLSKPWVQSYVKVTCGTNKKNPKHLTNTIVVPDCEDYNAWGHFHNMFIRDRLDVCGLAQEVEED